MMNYNNNKILGAAAKVALLFIANLLALSIVFAGKMQVTPLRAFLDNTNKNTTFTVSNPSNTEIAVQLDVAAWTQEDGQEIYTKTNEVLAVPVLFKILPGESQIIRTAIIKPNLTNKEKPYRLIFTEIPNKNNSSDAPLSLQMRLQINLPLFAMPENKVAPELKFIGTDQHNKGLIFENTGSQHIQIKQIKATHTSGYEKEETLSEYLLPGTKKSLFPTSMSIENINAVTFSTDVTKNLTYAIKP